MLEPVDTVGSGGGYISAERDNGGLKSISVDSFGMSTVGAEFLLKSLLEGLEEEYVSVIVAYFISLFSLPNGF